MGQSLFEEYSSAKTVFEEVNEALGQDLTKLMFDGPEDQLTLTENAQPALMAVSVAVMRTLEENGVSLAASAAYVAGHSLGEYSALTAAGAINLTDTAKLLKIRGQAMQKAVPVGEGAMAAILGLEMDVAAQVAREAAGSDVCATANDNAPGQVVLSGTKAAIERACEIAKDKGAKRAMLLPVSAPFHCSLMAPAAEAMSEALANVEIKSPVVPLVANVVADAVTDPEQIRKLLVDQVTGSVRWRESVAWMAAQGVGQVLEIGTGKVLTGLARRIDKSLSGLAVGTPDDIEKALTELS